MLSASGDPTGRTWETNPISDRFRAQEEYRAAVQGIDRWRSPRLTLESPRKIAAEISLDRRWSPRQREIALQRLISRSLGSDSG